MALLRLATLAASATQHQNGTFSLLEGGVRSWEQPQLPFLVPLQFVAEVDMAPPAERSTHAWDVETVFALDGEVVTRTGGVAVIEPGRFDADLGPVLTFIVPVGFHARRAGRYLTRLDIDGELLCELPLVVKTSLPDL